MKSVICQHCEAENEEGQVLCVACGRPLADDENGDAAPAIEGEPAADKEEVERWLKQLPDWTNADAERLGAGDESLPVWLQAVRAHADELTEEEADELLDFLSELEPGNAREPAETDSDAAVVQAKMTAELPSWVAALAPEEQWPSTDADDALSQHFAEAEESDPERLPSTAPLPQTAPLDASAELEGIPDRLAGDELPGWLADQAAAAAAHESEEAITFSSRKSRLRDAPPSSETADISLPEGEAEQGEVAAASAGSLDDDKPAGSPASSPDEGAIADELARSELEQTLQGLLDLPADRPSEERVDQWLDILEGLPETGDYAQLEEQIQDADIEEAEVPAWLKAMRPRGPGDQVELSELGQPEVIGEQLEGSEPGPPEEKGPLAGLRGVVPAATIILGDDGGRTAAQLQMSKGQRQQSALLRRLTMVEPQRAAAAEGEEIDSWLLLRVILGAALLLAVLLGWLVPGAADLLPWEFEHTLPPAAEMAQDVIGANSGRTALVAFDYTPSMAGELDSVALALLEDLAAVNSPVLSVSQFAAGVPVAQQATAAADSLDSTALGFLPGEATGVRAFGACLSQGCDFLAGRELSAEEQAALADVNLIVVLSAERDSLANWLEQVGTQSDIEIVAGVTSALGPVARAYLASEQLAGLVEGMPVAVAYSGQATLEDERTAEHLTSLTLAQWLVIGALLASVVYFGLVAPATSAVTQGTKE